jgi:NitT/TauT family transport system permease protein
MARRLFRVIVPAALPAVSASAQLLVSLTLALVVVCEMLIGTSGIGERIMTARNSYEPPKVYAWMILAGALGMVLSFVMRVGIGMIERRFYRPLRFPDE